MKTTAEIARHDEFSKGLIVSFGTHIAVALFFMIKTMIFPSEMLNSMPAVRVDLVALPDKIEPSQMPPQAPSDQPEAKAPPVADAKPEPVPPPTPVTTKPAEIKPSTKPANDAINLEKNKAKQSEALKKVKALEALDKIKDDVNKEAEEKKKIQALAAASKAQAGAMKIKGNQVALGTDLTGLDKLQHEDYRNLLDRHIKPNWQLPEWLGKKNFKAQVLVRIDERGRVISKKLVKTSGNRDFDESVLETIDRSTPMPAPPDRFLDKVAVEGILLEFGE